MTGSRNPNRTGHSGASSRVIRALALCFLLPPVGLVYMWRALVFPMRGRVLMTLVSMAELMLLFTWGMFGFITWSSLPDTVSPQPGLPIAVTQAPEDDTVNALSNIDALLSATDAAGSADAGDDASSEATPEPEATDVLTQDEDLAQQEAILDTTVYSVYSGAEFYHVSSTCGTQKNGRVLTVREALAEGLGACPNCNPPVP